MADGGHARYGRRDVLKIVGAGAVGTAGTLHVSGSGVADEHQDTFHNPTGPAGFGDPDVIRTCDGTYYVYGTETPEDVIPVARSEDLVNWTYIGSALERQPDWRDDPDAGVWAPTINWYNGQYYLYYSYSTWGSQDNPGIGLATAETPAGPFEDQGPIFRGEELSMTNAIDPDFLLVDGTPYVVWGSWYGLYAVELTLDGRDYVPGTAFQLAGDMKEGPMILEENGYYYLFYSTGHCCEGEDSTYELEVGRSDSFFGPYYNQNGDDLRDLNEHHSGVSVLTGTDRFVGTGHNTAVQDDDGDWWLLYHAEATTEYSNRVMMVDRIRWDDDWPVVGDDGTPSTESPMPVAGRDECGSAADVSAGTYRVESVESGARLTVEGDTSDDGVVTRLPDTDDLSQEWTVEHRANEEYTLANADSGQSLAVADAATSEGAPLQQRPSSERPVQRWYLVPVSTDDCVDVGLDGGPVCDVDGDGLYRDFTGDGEVGTTDVVEFFDRLQSDGVQNNVEYFDYTGTDGVGSADVVDLFEHVGSS